MDAGPKQAYDILDFIKKNVLNISEITRTTKLTQILDSYANKISDEFFVIQNTRNKEAAGVLSDLEYFQKLLMYEQAVESAIDEVIYEMALERKDDVADIHLGDVIDELNLDANEILKMAEEMD